MTGTLRTPRLTRPTSAGKVSSLARSPVAPKMTSASIWLVAIIYPLLTVLVIPADHGLARVAPSSPGEMEFARFGSLIASAGSPGLDDDDRRPTGDAAWMSEFAMSEAEFRALYERLRRASAG